MDKWMHGGAWLQPESGWLANPILGVRIDDLPIPHLGEVNVAFGLALADELPLLESIGVAIRILWTKWESIGVALHDRVVGAVDLDVESSAEDVLVNMPNNAGGDFCAKATRFAGKTGRGVDDPGRLHFVFNAPVLMEIPIRSVFVVANRRDRRDHQAPRSADLGSLSPHVNVLP